MSREETHIGRLKRVKFRGVEPEEYFKRLCNEIGLEYLPSWYSSWLDLWNDREDNVGTIVKNGDRYYQVIEDDDLGEENDICYVKDNGDDTFDYIMQFYNGGTYLQEMLEIGLGQIKEDKQ